MVVGKVVIGRIAGNRTENRPPSVEQYRRKHFAYFHKAANATVGRFPVARSKADSLARRLPYEKLLN